MQKAAALVLMFILAPGFLLAQSPSKETILIKAGRLVDVRSGRVLTRSERQRVRGDGEARFDAMQSIQAATVNAADLLGWSDRIGSIEPGRFADIIAVTGDPTTDVTLLEHITFVMKGGEVVVKR